MKPLDYSLYNRVKAKFPPQPNKIIFVSLAPENLADLHGQVFTPDDVGVLETLACEYSTALIPHAAIGGFEDGRAEFDFSCHEFQQEEDLVTGTIIASSIGTYREGSITIADLKRDLQKLQMGLDLVGNA